MNVFFGNNFDELKKLLESKKKIVIMPHYNPDGDALGSSLALNMFLNNCGHKSVCIYPSSYPKYFDWMPTISETYILKPNNTESIKALITNAEILFALDFNCKTRLNDLLPYFESFQGTKIMIDHHENPKNDFDLMFSNSKKSSTCELIFDFITTFSNTDNITLDIATCIFTGLITDTGGFQYSNINSSTHQIASTLLSKGIDNNEIFNKCFNNFSLSRLNLFSYCLTNNMKVNISKGIAYIWIDQQTKNMFNISEGDTEGLVNYPLKVVDIKMSVLFKEDINKTRISFRSKGNIDVNTIAKTHFGGGGHFNAAGATSKDSLLNTISFFDSLIENTL